MVIQQRYHPGFKFSDISFKKHEISEIAKLVGLDIPDHLKPWLRNMMAAERAEILCKDHAVISISRSESQWSGDLMVNLIKGEGDCFDVTVIKGNEIESKCYLSRKELLKLIARLNDQDIIEWQTVDSFLYLPADVEAVFLDLRFEEFSDDDIVLPSDKELLYPASRINKSGYLVRLNSLAAEEHVLDAIDAQGFHCSLIVGVDEIEMKFRRIGFDEIRVVYDLTNSKHGDLARLIQSANGSPGAFVIEQMDKEKPAIYGGV